MDLVVLFIAQVLSVCSILALGFGALFNYGICKSHVFEVFFSVVM
jgi:hypothetical protein